MTKTYKANTNISINVVLPSKKNLHITFTPLSNGTSVFITDNVVVQKAIESHYNFKKLFRLIEAQSVPAEPVKDQSINIENNDTDNPDGNDPDGSLKTIIVPDLASAKDYLADTFGVSRTAMRTEKQILKQAQMHGIKFDGI